MTAEFRLAHRVLALKIDSCLVSDIAWKPGRPPSIGIDADFMGLSATLTGVTSSR